MFGINNRYTDQINTLAYALRPVARFTLLTTALFLSLNMNAHASRTGWWNNQSDCMGKYYRYFDFDFDDRLRYFMPSANADHIHVQPILPVARNTYLDTRDNVEYVFRFKEGQLDIHWKYKDQNRTWHECHQEKVQPAYLSTMRAYLINRSYIDLAMQDKQYTGDDFLFQQCIRSYRDKNYPQAFDDCEFSWRSNKNGMSALYMAQMYMFGSLGKKDYEKALEWHLKSSTDGHPDSFGWLGWHYRFGKGTKQDMVLARKYYLISASHLRTDSSKAAAEMLILGQGGDVDYALAEKLLKIAVDADDIYGMNSLGVFYAKRWSGKDEDAKAFKLIKQASDRNHVRSRYSLAWFYILGIGTEPDKEKGEKILTSLESYDIMKEESFICALDVFQPPSQIERCAGYTE